MSYPQAFVDAVKKELPNQTSLHQALDEGSESVGHFLDDLSRDGFKPDYIVQMIEVGRSADLKAEAEHLIHIRQLYRQWLEIMCSSYE